jgi:cell division protein FtsN
MKKYIVLCAGVCLAMSFTSCGSSDKAYRKAYEKAQAQQIKQQNQLPNEQNVTVVETPVVTPVVTVPATETTVTDNNDNVRVVKERVSMVNGSGLLNYSVVVGSFSVIANAEGMQQRLKNAGYAAQIVKNEERNMYRVVASTFNNKADAVQSQKSLLGTQFNPDRDAWLLITK